MPPKQSFEIHRRFTGNLTYLLELRHAGKGSAKMCHDDLSVPGGRQELSATYKSLSLLLNSLINAFTLVTNWLLQAAQQRNDAVLQISDIRTSFSLSSQTTVSASATRTPLPGVIISHSLRLAFIRRRPYDPLFPSSRRKRVHFLLRVL